MKAGLAIALLVALSSSTLPRPTGTAVTVVHWNIHKGREECPARNHYDCQPNLRDVAAYLNNANADVVSLNEVALNRAHYNDNQPELLEQYLEAGTGQCWERYFTPANYPSAGDLGNLLLWRSSDDASCGKAPGRFHKQRVFSAGLPSQPADEHRAVGAVALGVGGRTVTFFTTHLCAPGACTNRQEQVSALLTTLRTFSGPRLVAGDFNARPTDAEISSATTGVSSEYVDLWPEAVKARTAAPDNPNQPSHASDWRPDYLWRSKDSTVSVIRMAIQRQINRQTRFDVSDHSPLVATLTIR